MKVAVIKFRDGVGGPEPTYLLINIHPMDPHEMNQPNIWEGTCIWDCQRQTPVNYLMRFSIVNLEFQFEADAQFISEYVAELL